MAVHRTPSAPAAPTAIVSWRSWPGHCRPSPSRCPGVQRFAQRQAHLPSGTLAAVKSLLAFGQRTGYLPLNVSAAAKVPTSNNTLAERILAEADVHRLLALERNRRNQVLLRLLCIAGLRVSEIAALTWRDLQPRTDGGQVTVFGKGSKIRTVLLPLPIWRGLVRFRHRAGLDEPLFASRRGGGQVLGAGVVDRSLPGGQHARAMWKGELARQLGWLEPRYFGQVVGRALSATHDLAQVIHVERVGVVLISIHDRCQQARQSDLQPRLLSQFPHSPLSRILPWIQEAARDIPAATGGLDGPTAQEHPPVADDHSPGTRLGIAEVHGPTRWAGLGQDPLGGSTWRV
jgi:Phage integrase family